MLIFEEHFQDNRHEWYLNDSSECFAGLESHTYIFEHKRSSNWCVAWNRANVPQLYDKTEFRIHVVIEKITGIEDRGYGFVWGLADVNNFFEFVISDNGYYRISKYVDGKFIQQVSWKSAYSVRHPNTINILEIHRNAEIMEIYINSVLVEKLPVDTQVTGNNFGFVIYQNMKIRIHSLIISTHSLENNSNKVHRSGSGVKSSFFEQEPPVDDTLEKVYADLQTLVGLKPVKQKLLSLANFLRVQTERKTRGLKAVDTSLHLILYGPPGTGKTTIARLMGRLYKQLGYLQQGHVVETDRSGIVGGYIGQTALRIDDAIRQALDGVLFIDEAYALSMKDACPNDFGSEAVQVLLKRMEDQRDRLAVIIAGYTEEMIHFIESNAGLQSRFSRSFYLDHYTAEEMVLIFQTFCHNNGYTVDDSAQIALQNIFEVAYTKRDKRFGNARFVRNLFEQSIEQQATRIANSLPQIDDTSISQVLVADIYHASRKGGEPL